MPGTWAKAGLPLRPLQLFTILLTMNDLSRSMVRSIRATLAAVLPVVRRRVASSLGPTSGASAASSVRVGLPGRVGERSSAQRFADERTNSQPRFLPLQETATDAQNHHSALCSQTASQTKGKHAILHRKTP